MRGRSVRLQGRWVVAGLVGLIAVAALVMGAVWWLWQPGAGAVMYGGVRGEVERGALVAVTVEALEGRFGAASGRRFRGWDAAFRLGANEGMIPIDSKWLMVRLRDGAVVEARVIED